MINYYIGRLLTYSKDAIYSSSINNNVHFV